MVPYFILDREERDMLMAGSTERMMQLEDYAIRHSTPLPPLLEELIATTREKMGNRSLMICGQIEGTLLQMLAVSVGARRILEVGMFTGYSALMMAAALPDEGELITCDIDPDAIALARSFFARSPDGSKIDIREGPALDTLNTLEGPFDLVFIDADKENYIAYWDACLPKVRSGGIIVSDNVLWSGKVLEPKEPIDHAVVAFNDHVRQDPRVETVMLPFRDGVSMSVKHGR